MPASTPASAEARPEVLPPVRAYGCVPADLDLDFQQWDRCALATAVVAQCCAEPASPVDRAAAALGLTLGQRVERLLQIVQLTTESEAITVVLACPQPSCAQKFEVGLPIDALQAGDSSSAVRERFVPAHTHDGRRVALRLPTGRDQAQWRRESHANAHDAALAMIRSLIVDGGAEDEAPNAGRTVTDADLASLSAAMETADPLVAFTVQTACPHCDREAAIAVDLEAAALQRLAQHRRSLLRTVHDLAVRYGWSESETLAIPAGRRAEYLRLIEAADHPLP